ncbi:hypothetical protein SAMN04488518_101753 [Pseudovibrio ascidiaceicola]|uniref:ArnR1-like winged helix-turn-helix domain-containing protein n=1 Tax=Pseudovibrio ascidiaceicola TaxID=285279 RepID=A0A1I3W188_9HYPH|nr:hypothetical protein [Pseudovibrio ascidiaceicola]SFK01192.1 hypothetical protein SAMN04488518_101753 [Pseudovibrio ascidiaceicola]
MSTSSSLPRGTLVIELIRSVLKQVKNGKEPHEIKTSYPNQDLALVVKSLVELGLVDHLSIVAALQSEAKSGTYFLTDKGLRWLRTYDRWEHFKHVVSKWQVLWGVILGVSINMVSNLIWPYILSFLSG